MFWDNLTESFFDDVAEKSINDFLLFPFMIIGACVVFILARGKKSIVVAYRFHASKYYGLLLVGIIFFIFLFIWTSL